ncbi:MAG: putative MFS-type transporter YxiO [Isosphaeraceae bacterium]|jgi:UMF1 family MFS transporter|nr:MAG: putative MFS-type transporter YxiO [Isosphaeraceae bacterium]
MDRREWLARLGLDRPEARAWAMYDWANSAMVTTIVAAIFPIYYGQVASAGLPAEEGTRRFAWVSVVSLAIVAVLAPVLGTLADTRPIKKAMLGGFLALGVASVGAMFFIAPGDWVLASVLFVLANVGANGSFVFYDALLPHVAREDELDRLSASGYALGYLGGGLLLALQLTWIQKPEWFGLPSGPGLTAAERTLPARLAFVSVAVWWALFAVPLFRRVREPAVAATAREQAHPLRATFSRLRQTYAELRRYPQAAAMLLAFLIYNDGIGTIIRMATKYGEELGIGTSTMIAALVLTQFVGIPFAFGFGALARRISAKRMILVALIIYIFICILGHFMRSGQDFVMLAVLVAMVQGGSQALSRSLFASLIPAERSGEFFGLFAVFEKFAGLFGPLLFAVGLSVLGSTRAAILTLIPFFVVGGWLLGRVDVERGRRDARSGLPGTGTRGGSD